MEVEEASPSLLIHRPSSVNRPRRHQRQHQAQRSLRKRKGMILAACKVSPPVTHRQDLPRADQQPPRILECPPQQRQRLVWESAKRLRRLRALAHVKAQLQHQLTDSPPSRRNQTMISKLSALSMLRKEAEPMNQASRPHHLRTSTKHSKPRNPHDPLLCVAHTAERHLQLRGFPLKYRRDQQITRVLPQRRPLPVEHHRFLAVHVPPVRQVVRSPRR